MLKLGKKPARLDAVKFKFSAYADTTALPPPPAVFGHQDAVTNWGMLGNDSVGDCVFAGAAHETMMWTTLGGKPAPFTAAAVLSDYSAVTGYDPKDPGTDQGTDMEAAAKYRRQTGVIDAAGARHQVAAYLALKVGDIDQLCQAAYLFGAVGIGIEVPSSAMDQFSHGKPWDVVEGSTIEGGHYVPFVGRDASGNLLVVTWGRVQPMTPAFFERYNDEAIVYLSAEDIVDGKSPEAFDYATLEADLAALGH